MAGEGATSDGVWQGDDPLDFELPLLIIQILLVLAVTRAIGTLLKPLRQPRVIAEIIGGILLGPSCLGRFEAYREHVFPARSLQTLETVANLGLLFFLFLVGLELDLKAVKRTGRQALAIAAAGICVPFLAGAGVSAVMHAYMPALPLAPFVVFMGVAMSITAFPVLARILAERKLLTTDVGQMAMSAAAVNDIAAWIILAVAVAMSGGGRESPAAAAWVLLCALAFVGVMFGAVRPLLAFAVRLGGGSDGPQSVSEAHVMAALAGVLASGLATDAIGIHAIFGGFVFGLVVPKEGPFAGALVEKVEDLVTIVLLPLYFTSSGLKTDIGAIRSARSWGFFLLVVCTACVGKVGGTVAVAPFFNMKLRKAATLGFLMNTKGLVELIVLNIGRNRKVLNDETFAILVLMALFTTFMTTPIVMALYKPARNPVPYNRRTLYCPSGTEQTYSSSTKGLPATSASNTLGELQHNISVMNEDDEQLRVLACVHGMPNVHAIINLIEASRGTRKKPLRTYILHLLHLSERPSAILKVQQVRRNGMPSGGDGDVDNNMDMDSVVLAFEAFGKLSKVRVQAMSAISSFDDMHADICHVAADRRAAVVVLPFYKHSRPQVLAPSVWEAHHPGLRGVIQRVLQHAPCSVAILVDRGIGWPATSAPSSSSFQLSIAVLFFGGPDDREALAFGHRMAEHPGVKLTVFRFILAAALASCTSSSSSSFSSSSKSSCTPADGHSSVTADHHPHHAAAGATPGGETHDFMITGAALDVAHEHALDHQCLRMFNGRTINTENNLADEQANPSNISYEDRVVSHAGRAAEEIATSTTRTFDLLLVGRGRRPSPLVAPLGGQQAQYPELGPIGEVLITNHCLSSVLVIQSYDASLQAKVDPAHTTTTDVLRSSNTTFLSRNMQLVATAPRPSSAPSSPTN